MTLERWAPIADHPGYEASDQGRIRSVERVLTCKDGRRQRWPGQLLSPRPDGKGRLYANIAGRNRLVGALVLEAFVGPRPPEMVACHRNDRQADNRLSNLRWDTHRENMLDVVRNGNHRQSAKTHCPLDHPFIVSNLVVSLWKQGRRTCLACHRARARVSYLRRKGVAADMRAIADRYFAALAGESELRGYTPRPRERAATP